LNRFGTPALYLAAEGWQSQKRRSLSATEPLVLSLDFDHEDEVVSAWSDGTIQRGDTPTPLFTFTKVRTPRVSWGARVRCSSSSSAGAVLWEPWSTEARTPEADRPRSAHWFCTKRGEHRQLPTLPGMMSDLAWSPRGDEFAITYEGGVALYDQEGKPSRTFPWMTPFLFSSRIAWTRAGLCAASQGHLELLDPETGETFERGALTEPPAGSFVEARLLTATLDGRLAVCGTAALDPANAGVSQLFVYDLVSGSIKEPLHSGRLSMTTPLAIGAADSAAAWVTANNDLRVELLQGGPRVGDNIMTR
jgi:hypothetical protein